MKRLAHRSFYLSIPVILVSILMGCINVDLKSERPKKDYYVLDVSREEEPYTPIPGMFLEVRKLNISPRYEGKGFIYREGDLSYESDFYNQFFKPPASLITEEVRDWLKQSGLFEHIVYSASDVETLYVLDGAVTALYGDYSEDKSPKAVLGIRFSLKKDIPAGSKIIFQQGYLEEVPLEATSPEALAQGWNMALKKILTDLEEDLKEKLLSLQVGVKER